MPRALITGISGFAGSHLAEHLLASGDTVAGVVREEGEPANLRAAAARIELFRADILDVDALAGAIARAAPDHVYHLAAYPVVGDSFRNALECWRVNVIGTATLFEAVRRAKARPRVLYVGTGQAYGRAGGAPVPETAPLRPISPYAASKTAAEMAAVEAHEARGLEVLRARSFNHAGPRQDANFVVSAFARQIADAEAGRGPREIRVGNLEPVRDISDVRDVVRGYRALMLRGAPGEVYNVASGKGTSIRAVLERLVALARVPVEIVDDPERYRPADMPHLVGDPTKFERTTALPKGRPLDETLRDVLEDWRARAS